MISSLKEIVAVASKNLQKRLGLHAIIKSTKHFQDRLIQRFSDDDLEKLEKAVEKAFEKAKPSNTTFKYTHPAYNITVVIRKQGLNMIELVTCWKQGDEDPEYV